MTPTTQNSAAPTPTAITKPILRPACHLNPAELGADDEAVVDGPEVVKVAVVVMPNVLAAVGAGVPVVPDVPGLVVGP